MSHPMVSCSVVYTAMDLVADRMENAVKGILCGSVWPTGLTVVARGPSKRIHAAWVRKCKLLLSTAGIDGKIVEPDRPIRLGEALNDGVFESKALWIITPPILDDWPMVSALLNRIHAEPERGQLLAAGPTPAFTFKVWAAEALKECGSEGDRIAGTGGFNRYAQDPIWDFCNLLAEGGIKPEAVDA